MEEYPITYTDTLWTYRDYEEIPWDGKTYQIITGALYMVPSPSSNHQEISGNLYAILRSHVKKNDLGKVFYSPMDVIFTQTDVVQPDVFFVSKKRCSILQEKGIFGAPDFIAEIISPSTRHIDEKLKKGLYERHGVIEYLIVYPEEEKALLYGLEGGGYHTKGIYTSADKIPLRTLSMDLPLEEVFDY